MRPTTQPLKLTLLAASLLLFAWSLTCDAYYTEARNEGAPAFLALLTGWMGILNGGFSWLANPALASAWLWLLLKLDLFAAISAAAATLIASTFLLQSSILVDEAGHMGRISGVGLGYWLWLASIASALVAACCPPMRSSRTERTHPA